MGLCPTLLQNINSMIYGYAKFSVDSQIFEDEIAKLRQLGCDEVLFETAQKNIKNKPVLINLISRLRNKDVLTVLNFKNLARSLNELVILLDAIASRKVVLNLDGLIFDFSSEFGQSNAFLLGELLKFEKQIAVERSVLGLNRARSMERFGGKQRGFSESIQSVAKRAYLNRKKGMTVKENLLSSGIKSRETLFKYIHLYAELISEQTGRPLTDDGLDVINEN